MAIGENLTQRQQILIAVTVIFAGLAGAYWYFPYRQNLAAMDAEEQHVVSVEKTNAMAKQDLARGTAKALREEADRFARNLDMMRALVPTTTEVSLLVDQVSTAARRAGLEIGNLTPQPIIAGPEFDTYRYSLGVVGNYHEIGSFLANVGGLTRIVTPVGVKVQDVDDKSTGRRTKTNEALIRADMEIRTYVAHMSSAPLNPGTRGNQ